MRSPHLSRHVSPPSPAAAAPRERRRRWWPMWLALAITATLAGCAAFDAKQREWIFQPTDRSWPAGLAAAQGMQDVWIAFDSRETGQPTRLHGLWLPQEGRPDAPLLLYLHGARWDVRGSAHRMRRMHELGFAVLGVDYRGFGQSTPGLPSEAMAVEDARAGWDWLAAQHPGRQRYLFGHSLGGAIAVRLAAELGGEVAERAAAATASTPPATPSTARSPQTEAPLSGLIVEGSFTSVADVVSRHRWGWLPVGPLITQRFEAGQHIARVRAPVLVVHGSDDQMIHPELGRALYDLAPEPKRFLLVEGGSHHNTNAVGQSLYRDALAGLFGLGGGR